jgi:hypothetical protein
MGRRGLFKGAFFPEKIKKASQYKSATGWLDIRSPYSFASHFFKCFAKKEYSTWWYYTTFFAICQ